MANTIPFIDLRGKTAIDLLRAYPDRARDLMKASRRTFGIWSEIPSYLALPVADFLSHRWLKRQRNPYLYEIESCAEILGGGTYTFNVCMEWGCTTGVWQNGEELAMLRVLDWPFPALGKTTVIALQEGKAGTFYNITWPGTAGVFTGMAPGRFSAAINQAPMRRHRLTYAGDWVANRLIAARQRGLPPAHVLRQVFETARDYNEAKKMLMHAPLAVPVIFTLAGTKQGEGCVIERLEHVSGTIELEAHPHIATANHFMNKLDLKGKGWRPREIDSAGRYRQTASIGPHELDASDFRWLSAPIINANTRLSVVANAATGRLQVQGFEGVIPVTGIFQLPAMPQKQADMYGT